MAKRKFWVETINSYVGSYYDPNTDILYEVPLKVNGVVNQAEADLTGKTNPGGQAWDWATSHWDEFIPEDGPQIRIVVREDDGSYNLMKTVDVRTKLRWACITGVYADEKKKKHLPISEVGYKAGKNSSYGRSQKQKRGKATPKFKTKEDQTTGKSKISPVKERHKNKQRDFSTSKTKVKERKELLGKVPVVPSNTPNSLDMDAIRAAKIAKVMEEEEEVN